MNIFFKGRGHITNANAVYDEKTNKTIVKKDSVVSEVVLDFPRKNVVEELRKRYVDNKHVVKEDVSFNNPTSAAEFVCGYSVSGPNVWNVEPHKKLKDYISRQ